MRGKVTFVVAVLALVVACGSASQSSDAVLTARHLFAIGNRLMKKKLFAMVALDKLRRYLLGLPELDLTGFEPHGKA